MEGIKHMCNLVNNTHKKSRGVANKVFVPLEPRQHVNLAIVLNLLLLNRKILWSIKRNIVL